MTPNQKKLDLASIIIIGVSVLLILAGFYLLNRNYSKQGTQNTVVISSSSSVLASSSKAVSSPTVSSISVSSSSLVENSSSVSVVSSAIASSSAVNSSSSNSSNIAVKSELNASTAIVKIAGIEGSKYEIEVLDTGFQNGNLWKVGNKFKVNIIDFQAKVGSEYKLTGIGEKGNSSSFELITENK